MVTKINTRVFLGGTCNGSTWRDDMIKMLTIDYFNPVVENWTEACMDQEIWEREHCDVVLYAVTPKMTGVYSIAEVVDDSNKQPGKTVLILLQKDIDKVFDKGQWRSLKAVAQMVERNGGAIFYSLKEAALAINQWRVI